MTKSCGLQELEVREIPLVQESLSSKEKNPRRKLQNLQGRHECKPVSLTKLTCKRYAANFLMNFPWAQNPEKMLNLTIISRF